MAARGSLHDLRADAFNYVWDNSLEPALEVEPGDEVLLHVRDASDEQIHEDSGVEDVLNLDFSHVNPVSGPVLVKGARPGDVLEVELLEFSPQGWGWTAIIPGFGLLADEYPEPWLRISRVDPESGKSVVGSKLQWLVQLRVRPTCGELPCNSTSSRTNPADRSDGEAAERRWVVRPLDVFQLPGLFGQPVGDHPVGRVPQAFLRGAP